MRMSLSIAKKLYGFLGGTKSGNLRRVSVG